MMAHLSRRDSWNVKLMCFFLLFGQVRGDPSKMEP